MADVERVAKYFEHFARITEGESPLYAALSTDVANDDDLLALTDHIAERQPPANVLFAAVHVLLLGGAEHPLGEYYASVGGSRAPDADLFGRFKDFCGEHHDDLVGWLAVGRTQTNEVRRAAFLLPAFNWIAERAQQPLATIEVGTAAGLLTLWDHYAYDYGTATVGESSLTLSSDVVGGHPPIGMPEKAWSVGIDFEPIALDDPDAAAWLRALVWPDQVERLERLDGAIAVAREHPPELIKGDGIDLVADQVRRAPPEALAVVHHSFALNQVSPQDRFRFLENLMEVSTERKVYLVAVEWAGTDADLELRAGAAFRSEVARKTLARVHHHGAWIDWWDER